MPDSPDKLIIISDDTKEDMAGESLEVITSGEDESSTDSSSGRTDQITDAVIDIPATIQGQGEDQEVLEQVEIEESAADQTGEIRSASELLFDAVPTDDSEPPEEPPDVIIPTADDEVPPQS